MTWCVFRDFCVSRWAVVRFISCGLGALFVSVIFGHLWFGCLDGMIDCRSYLLVWAGLAIATSLLWGIGLPIQKFVHKISVSGFIGLILFGTVCWVEFAFDSKCWRSCKSERWRMLSDVSSSILVNGTQREKIFICLGESEGYYFWDHGSSRHSYVVGYRRSDALTLYLDFDSEDRPISWETEWE